MALSYLNIRLASYSGFARHMYPDTSQLWPIHWSWRWDTYFESPSTCIDLTFHSVPPQYSYMLALQNIIPSAQHIAAMSSSGDTGNWFSLSDVQNNYNQAAWPNNQNEDGAINGRSDVFSSEQPSSFFSFQYIYPPSWELQHGLSSWKLTLTWWPT